MTHYVYKIIFLQGRLKGKYYIGKRSFDGIIEKDRYCGSGKVCDDYFKTHKRKLNETYKKEILKVCDSEDEAYLIEEKMLGDLYETDENCVNVKPGGKGGFSTKEPWNKGKKGCQVAWNKGLTNDDPRVKKYSDAKRGRYHKPWNKGLKGLQVAWNKGKGGYIVKTREVEQYTLNGELVAIYPNMKQAAKQNNFDEHSISKCCRKIKEKYNNFIWKFKNNEE